METVARSISIALCGSGGSGVMTAGQILLDAAALAGYYGLMARSSGPQIRGGEAAAMLRLSPDTVYGPADSFDLLLAFDWSNIERFAAELPLRPNSLIVGDPSQGDAPALLRHSGAPVASLPLKDLARSIPGGRVNMVGLGAVARLIGLPISHILDVLAATLQRKGPEAMQASELCLEAGHGAAAALPPLDSHLTEADSDPVPRWNISGNEAAGLGALRGGVRFVAAYPITPATEMLEWLAPNIEKLGGTLVQAEDELASINMVLGASFGGLPALTATAGPGLALMTESLGLAVASETPVVVVDVMRGGPSTGIPTKSEQTDLNIALYGLHGDAPHLVLAPNSIGDCLFTVQWAVHLAEALQCPAIVLSDQAMGQTRAIIDKPADLAFIARRVKPGANLTNYERYALTPSGISPMALPGLKGGEYTADGLEHSVKGNPSSQAADHQAQLDKRARKLELFDYGDHWADIEGDGEIAVVTWGSVTAPVREALDRAGEKGLTARLISLRLLSPIQPERMAAALTGVSRILVVEQSHSGQFLHYLKAHFDLPGEIRTLHRAGPLPFRPAEVEAALADWIEDLKR